MNWKYILIVIILASAAGWGILAYEKQMTKEINAPAYVLDIKKPAAAKAGQEEKSVELKLFDEISQELISKKTDFLEINLSEMKITLYKNGLAEKKVSIVTKGDPQSWGGSAAGLYKIMSGNKSSFSIVSDVYMPYSLRYYGKYYIHGEPYYPWGEKLNSSISGGCLRLKNKDAETIYELTEINMPVLVIDKKRDAYEYVKEKKSALPKLCAQSYLVADIDSGYILAEKNSQEQLPIASLTKLMTALVLAENIDLRKSILIKEEMLNSYGSAQGLTIDERFRVVELFYPLLTESSNNAAEVLCYFLGKEKTINLMNEKAKAISMEQTKFVDSSGYDPENISTAKDLFYLARYILNNRPPILNITKGEKVQSFGKLNFEVKDLWNKNIFINDATFVGGKTGFIKSSKNTALFIFRFTSEDNIGRNIAITLLNSENIKSDTQKIYIWLQNNYFGKQDLAFIKE